MASRSQRARRYREGLDADGVTAMERGERSLVSQADQRTKSVAYGHRPPAACTVAPAVSGTPTSGQTLTTTNGTWTGQGSITYARQWYRGNTPISGATALTYVLTAAEVGYYVFCRVTATDSYGANTQDSNIVGPVA